MRKTVELPTPEWLLDGGLSSCEQCGHYSNFEAGFEVEDGRYVRGWYSDEISCYNWRWYDPEEDTREAFEEFLRSIDELELLEKLNEETN